MEGTDPAGFASRHKAIRRIEKIHRQRVPEGVDRTASGYGGKRAVKPQGLCRGTAPCRVHTNRPWLQLEAYFGRHVELGRRIQGQTIKRHKPVPMRNTYCTRLRRASMLHGHSAPCGKPGPQRSDEQRPKRVRFLSGLPARLMSRGFFEKLQTLQTEKTAA